MIAVVCIKIFEKASKENYYLIVVLIVTFHFLCLFKQMQFGLEPTRLYKRVFKQSLGLLLITQSKFLQTVYFRIKKLYNWVQWLSFKHTAQ